MPVHTYEKENYCSKCYTWFPKNIIRCPECLIRIRTLSKSKKSDIKLKRIGE
jgi:hypothetical protein